MARIRSIHPGFLTDEATMLLTVEAPLAVLLVEGLWMAADDCGTFEWKPLTLKAQVLPAIAADVMMKLLDLLQRSDIDMVKRFEIEGKQYGIVRNFVRYQRPKSPKRFHPVTPDSMAYAGFLPDGSRPRSELGGPTSVGSSELREVEREVGSESNTPKPPRVANKFRTSSEIPPQMEEGGGIYPEAEGELSRLQPNPETGELRRQDRALPSGAPVALVRSGR